jgi:hypothetical protein
MALKWIEHHTPGETAWFHSENTVGYTQAALDALNAALEERLQGMAPHTDEWHEAIKRFERAMVERARG